MNTCLLSKQNGFSKFPPGKRDLSSLGAGSSSLPPLLPTPTSTFSFFVFLRRISTGENKAAQIPRGLPDPLHAECKRQACTPCQSPPRGQRNKDMSGVPGQLTGTEVWGLCCLCSNPDPSFFRDPQAPGVG